jgi:hypothetical protein
MCRDRSRNSAFNVSLAEQEYPVDASYFQGKQMNQLYDLPQALAQYPVQLSSSIWRPSFKTARNLETQLNLVLKRHH